MIYRRTERFRSAYAQLPKEIQYMDNPAYDPTRDDEAKKTICLFRNIGRHEIVDTSP